MPTGIRWRDLALIVSSVVILGVAAGATWYFEQLRVQPPDYCPTGTWPQRHAEIRSPGHTALVIDTSNEISAMDGRRAREVIRAWARDGAPFLQRVSIYGLPESSAESAGPGRDSFCVPKDGADANKIYENSRFVEAAFRRFLFRFDKILIDLIGHKEADESPIIETMAELVNLHEDLDSFVLVSDMLQNTPIWSHYTQSGDMARVEAVCREITQADRVESVDVYYIHRPDVKNQETDWPDAWWQDCLDGVEMRMLNGTVESPDR